MLELSGIVSAVSAAIALASFVFAVMAFRRTSRLQDADYRPQIAFDHDELGGVVSRDLEDAEPGPEDVGTDRLERELQYSGQIRNVGSKPVHLIKAKVCLGPRHRDDPDCAMVIPLNRTEPPGGSHKLAFALEWETIWAVARSFRTQHLDLTLVVTIRGADGVTRELCPRLAIIFPTDEEWCAVAPKDMLAVFYDLQQAKLRHDSNRSAAYSQKPDSTNNPHSR